eukprot:2836862-Rhodomonas_salina.7
MVELLRARQLWHPEPSQRPQKPRRDAQRIEDSENCRQNERHAALVVPRAAARPQSTASETDKRITLELRRFKGKWRLTGQSSRR